MNEIDIRHLKLWGRFGQYKPVYCSGHRANRSRFRMAWLYRLPVMCIEENILFLFPYRWRRCSILTLIIASSPLISSLMRKICSLIAYRASSQVLTSFSRICVCQSEQLVVALHEFHWWKKNSLSNILFGHVYTNQLDIQRFGQPPASHHRSAMIWFVYQFRPF